MSDALERVRAAGAVTEAAETARLRVHDGRGMEIEGIVDLRAHSGHLEGTVDRQQFPRLPDDLAEKVGGAFGRGVAQVFGSLSDLMAKAPTARAECRLDDGELYRLSGDRWLSHAGGMPEYGGAPPWQHDPLWLLDLLPFVSAADEVEDGGYAILADAIAAAETTDRPIRLPAGTLAGLRAFPAEVRLDDEGRVRRMRCGPPPPPEFPRWSAELSDFGVDEPVETPDLGPQGAG